MAKLSFYTNTNTIRPQGRNHGFGPVDPSENLPFNRPTLMTYNLGSIHQSDSTLTNPPAIAIGNGSVCFIKSRYFVQSGSNYNPYYHAIFKPDNDTLDFYPKLKYVIYRMIPHDVLFSNTSAGSTYLGKALKKDTEGGSTLNNSIWRSYNNDPRPDKILPSEVHLGAKRLDFLQSLSDNSHIYIDDLFYYNFKATSEYNNLDYPLPRVSSGDSLGFFLKLNQSVLKKVTTTTPDSYTPILQADFFSVEFMLDSPDYNPTIADLFYQETYNDGPDNKQLIHNQINILRENNLSPFQLDALKSKCLNYIDPIAFYGAIFNHNNKPGIENSDKHNVYANSVSTPFTEAVPFYKKVYLGTDNSGNINNEEDAVIYNRNRVYVDIRDRFSFPYSFFRDKDGSDNTSGTKIPENNLALSIDTAPVVPVDYNNYNFRREIGSGSSSDVEDTDMYQWPILILDYNTGVTVNYNNDNTGNSNALKQPIGFKGIEGSEGAGFNSKVNLAFPNFDYLKKEVFLFLDDSYQTNQPYTQLGIDTDIFLRETPVASNLPFCGTYTLGVPTTDDHRSFATYCRVRYIEYFKEVIDAEWYDPENYTPGKDGYPLPLYMEKTNYLDYLFPVEMKDKHKNYIDSTNSKTHVTSSVWYDQAYVDNTLVSGRDFIGHLGIATDAWKTGSATAPESDAKVVLFSFDTIPVIGRINVASDGTGGSEVRIPPDGSPPPRVTKTNIKMEFVVNEFAAAGAGDQYLFYQELTDDRLRTIAFGRRDIHPDPLNPAVTVKVDLITNSSATNLNVDTFVWSDNGFRRTEDFVYVGVPKSDYNDIVDNIYPTQFLNDNSYVKGTPVFFGFNPVASGLEQTLEWVKYEIVLKGYKIISGEPELISFSTGKYIYESVNSFNMSGYRIPDEPNSKGFQVHTIPGGGLPSTEEIHCNIYLAKSPDISHEEFEKYSDYHRANIRHVYNTTTNKGLTAAIRSGNSATVIGNLPNPYQQINAINADHVNIYNATPMQFKMLKENEIILIVQGNFFGGRASIVRLNDGFGGNGNIRRQGTMCLLRSSLKTIPGTTEVIYRNDNTAAHEFGHVMSLADRYTQLVRLSTTPNKLDDSSYNSVILYIDPTYDPDYSVDFRWVNNLMGFDLNVPFDNTGPMFNTNVHSDYWLRNNEFKSSSNDPDEFGNIFITPNQWQRILAAGSANGPSDSETFEAVFNGRDASYILPNSAGLPANSVDFFGYKISTNNYISDRTNDNSSTNRLENHTQEGRAIVTALSGFIDPLVNLNSASEAFSFVRSIPNNEENTKLLELGISKVNLLSFYNTQIEAAVGDTIVIAIDPIRIQTVHTDYNSPKTDWFNGDTVGNAVWNYLETCPLTTLQIVVTKTTNIPITVQFTYTMKFSNRIKIVSNV